MTEAAAPEHAEHFESLAQQARAARLGMWVFLASEVLLFALYASYRLEFPAPSGEAVRKNATTLGSPNTGVLRVSRTLVAGRVHALRAGRTKLATPVVLATMAVGLGFLAIKATEYRLDFTMGFTPAAKALLVAHPGRGLELGAIHGARGRECIDEADARSRGRPRAIPRHVHARRHRDTGRPLFAIPGGEPPAGGEAWRPRGRTTCVERGVRRPGRAIRMPYDDLATLAVRHEHQ